MLSRATYPDLWNHPGYPATPSVPALVGQVIHKSLELIIDSFATRGCIGPNTECATLALRTLGGYTAVISQIAAAIHDRLREQPNGDVYSEKLREALFAELPDIRQRVQSLVARSELVPRPQTAANLHAVARQRVPLGPGSHAEVDLLSPLIAWTGRADLINIGPSVIEIVDYKTGYRHHSHADQLRTYALLWFRDPELNPSERLATRLVLRYPDEDAEVDFPTKAQLLDLEMELAARTQSARAELAKRPPSAKPSEENCSGCPVRQLCAEYWSHLAGRQKQPLDPDGALFGDVELRIEQRSGARSWLAKVIRSDKLADNSNVLLRTVAEIVSFREGQRIRMLNAAIGGGEPTRVAIAQTSNSEVFQGTA